MLSGSTPSYRFHIFISIITCNHCSQKESSHSQNIQLEIPCVPSKYVIPDEKVEKQLRKLDTGKAPGPDSIPSWVLKEFSVLLAGPVAAIYNSSLREGLVPRIWRAAYVSPLPKRKPPEHIETDLRPISLTAVLCKQMEEFVVKWVLDIVQDRVTQTNMVPLRSQPFIFMF